MWDEVLTRYYISRIKGYGKMRSMIEAIKMGGEMYMRIIYTVLSVFMILLFAYTDGTMDKKEKSAKFVIKLLVVNLVWSLFWVWG